MKREICRDMFLLQQKAKPAVKADAALGHDLMDTLVANRDRCVGMAANMIGVPKAIIVFYNGQQPVLMYNPVIVKKSGAYETEEGCLSLSGVRPTTRYTNIEVSYENTMFQKCRSSYSGYVAEIIQHEIDHLSGILI